MTRDRSSADLRPLEYGVATSSFQIEGATAADGRGPSIWDTLCRRPGAIKDGSDGSVACGSYDRLDEDVALIEGLGVAAYRFSIAWPRVQPEGRGPANPRGFDYYDRLVDALLARRIDPMVTLYHWDLPQPLEDAGGWPVRDTVARFVDYTELVHARLGDRITRWATHNEPWCAAFLGYAAGVHAPGRTEPEAAYAAAHHLLLSHAQAAAAVRAADDLAQVGIVLNMSPVRVHEPGAEVAAQAVDAIQNRLWMDPLVQGTYPDDLLAIAAPLADPALVRDGDLASVRGSAAWIGINYYTPFRVGLPETADDPTRASGQLATAYPGAPPCSFYPREPRTSMGWEVDPGGLEDILRWTAQRAPGIPLAVTENGSAWADGVRSADGSVRDDDRIAYLRAHLDAVHRARAAGADVETYVAWTLLDNFEWGEGYTQKFGLVEVEPSTLRRAPKASYWAYAEIARP